jgi:hypothetical protein
LQQTEGALAKLQAYAANPPATSTAAILTAVNYMLVIVGWSRFSMGLRPTMIAQAHGWRTDRASLGTVFTRSPP